MYANIFGDAGQVPILRYFEAWYSSEFGMNMVSS